MIFDAINLDLSSDISPHSIYTTVFITLLTNGMTNLPSSQIIYLTLGYLVNTATFNVAIAILLGALANHCLYLIF
jgi:membrane protein DedA with SNARE-associated domain